jgi:hypothetical protein
LPDRPPIQSCEGPLETALGDVLRGAVACERFGNMALIMEHLALAERFEGVLQAVAVQIDATRVLPIATHHIEAVGIEKGGQPARVQPRIAERLE